MASDFSALGRSAREQIPVPAVPMESIRARSRTARFRGRMRAIAACAAVSLSALGVAAGAGEKIYNGVRIWLSGDKVAVVVPSGVLMHYPKAEDLRKAIRGATFPVVFPVGVPAGSRVTMMTLAPAERPSMISVSYQNEAAGFKASFAMVDPAVIAPAGSAAPAASSGLRAGYHWKVRGELVRIGDKHLSAAQLDRIKAAMLTASPSESLAATEAMLTKITVLGGTVRLAIAERYRPLNGQSVLLDEGHVKSIPSFVKNRAPMLDNHILTITNIVYGKGDIAKGSGHGSKTIAVSSDGVRAIDAVLRSTGGALHGPRCGCEILFHQPNPRTYWVWNIPASGSAVEKYAVDARTFAVTPVTGGEPEP